MNASETANSEPTAERNTIKIMSRFGNVLKEVEADDLSMALDKAGAIAWAKEFAPAAVVQREDLVTTPLKDREDLPEGLFEVTGPSDRFYIKTGIGK